MDTDKHRWEERKRQAFPVFSIWPNGLLRACYKKRPVRGLGLQHSAASGFSLVETLCAVLILGVALTGLVQGVTTGLSSNKESELQTVAALFAAGRIETTRAEGELSDGTTDGDCGEELSLYSWQQTISPAGIDGLHEVTVVVQNAKSGKAIYELKTLLFEVPEDSPTRTPNSRRDSGSQRRRSGSR